MKWYDTRFKIAHRRLLTEGFVPHFAAILSTVPKRMAPSLDTPTDGSTRSPLCGTQPPRWVNLFAKYLPSFLFTPIMKFLGLNIDRIIFSFRAADVADSSSFIVARCFKLIQNGIQVQLI